MTEDHKRLLAVFEVRVRDLMALCDQQKRRIDELTAALSLDVYKRQGILNEIMPVQADIRGRMVILLEDIIDTGFTMSYVMEKLRSEGAADVRLATMLFKPESLKCELTPDYVGLQIPADFIVGHGLDYDELGRSYKDIYKVVE